MKLNLYDVVIEPLITEKLSKATEAASQYGFRVHPQADKKEVKAAVKSLGKERKAFLKEYTGASDEKDEFYKKFSNEAGEKVEGYNQIVQVKLKMTRSAASQ